MPGPDMAKPDDPNIPSGATIGSCAGGDWVVSASNFNFDNLPGYAVDGLLPSRWSTGVAQAPGIYYQIDFGGWVMLNNVTLNEAYNKDGVGDYPRGLDVFVSPDGTDFSRKLASAAPASDPGTLSIDFTAHAARYLRLQLNTATSPVGTTPAAWWTVHELTLGCTAPNGPGPKDMGFSPAMGPLNPNKAGWTVTASVSDGSSPAANAIDSDTTTRWATGKTPQQGDETFRLDLGQATSISQIWLSTSGGDYPGAWELDLSSDGTTFNVAARGVGADVTKMVFPTQMAKVALIKQIGTGYEHWWSITDISVY
jgi:hypothetical protein